MKNKYFYHDGIREFGPFTAQELLDKKIRPDYKLRLESEESFVIAKDVEEVAMLFKTQTTFHSFNSTAVQDVNKFNMENSHQNEFERDINFEQQNFDPNYNKSETTNNWRAIVLIIVLSFWLIESIIHWVMTLLSIDAWFGPGRIISGFVSVLFAFVPLLIAICIRESHLKIIAIIIGSILTLSMLSKQIYWTFQLL